MENTAKTIESCPILGLDLWKTTMLDQKLLCKHLMLDSNSVRKNFSSSLVKILARPSALGWQIYAGLNSSQKMYTKFGNLLHPRLTLCFQKLHPLLLPAIANKAVNGYGLRFLRTSMLQKLYFKRLFRTQFSSFEN